ncbi:hypothetical protein ACFV8Z_29960 [Streptomyces sp. NPDC059837]|uniref:hypothetical protein n=1 Tax=Streptomyces sp. NPDC059837 TaxID=3346968 RepID=UPI00365AA253
MRQSVRDNEALDQVRRELRLLVWRRSSYLVGEIEYARFRDFRESVILVVERSAINPRREIRWEKVHIFLCILAIMMGAVLTSYTAGVLAPIGAVVTVKNKNADPRQSFVAFFVVTLGLSLIGLIVDRRRVIYRMAVGRVKPDRYEELNHSFSAGYVFHLCLPGVALPGAVSACVLLQNNYGHWPYGWALVVVTGLMIGYAAGQSTWALWAWVMRRTAADSEQALDVAVKALFMATTLLYLSLQNNEYSLRSVRRYVRMELFSLASAVEHNKMPLTFVLRGERALRSEVKIKHARIAQAIRVHSRKLATVQTEEQYRNISSSLLGGLLAALEGDIDVLLEGVPEVSRSSRVRNFLRHVTPALAMVLFAAIIPILPGVGDAAGSVRVLLLATAVLTLIPGASSARPTIESALGKALPGPQKS